MFNKTKSGFTLVEIMIVVAIIALLATIAIPGILRSRQTANESNAIASLKTIGTGAETFRAASGTNLYPLNLAALTVPNPPYITGFSAAGVKAGYTFTLVGDNVAGVEFDVVAIPNANSGQRAFCIDQRGDVWSTVSGTIAYAQPGAGVDCAVGAIIQ